MKGEAGCSPLPTDHSLTRATMDIITRAEAQAQGHKDPRRFYVYAYVREDGTPYYIGRGQSRRAYNHSKRDACPTPSDKSFVKILASGLTTQEANEWESDLIEILGRESHGTGCLVNKRDGGESLRNMVYPKDFGQRCSAAAKKRPKDFGQRVSAGLKGRPKSEAHKQALSESRKGVRISAQTALKISEANSVSKRWFHPEHGVVVCGGKQLAAQFLSGVRLSTASAHLSRVANGIKRSAYGWTCLDAPTRATYEHPPEVLVFVSPKGERHKGTAAEVARAIGACRKALRKLAAGKKPRKDSQVFGWSVAA